MINYKKTILYEIYNDVNDIKYYGISANKGASTQLAYYKNYYKKMNRDKMKNQILKKLFKLFDEIGVDNIKIKTIDYIELENKFDLNKYLSSFIKGKICLNN
jgi:transposase